jgi:hypothetical protein
VTSLSPNSKRFALFVIALGAYTFLLPMVIVNPPVLNRTEWSPLDIAWNIYERKLPVRRGTLDWGSGGLLDMALIYLLMPLSAAAIYLPGPPKVLRALCAVGSIVSFEANWWRSTYLWLFGYFGHMQYWHMGRGLTWWVLPLVMPVLLFISFSGTRQATVRTM